MLTRKWLHHNYRICHCFGKYSETLHIRGIRTATKIILWWIIDVNIVNLYFENSQKYYKFIAEEGKYSDENGKSQLEMR